MASEELSFLYSVEVSDHIALLGIQSPKFPLYLLMSISIMALRKGRKEKENK